jgi:DNA-binding NtrC family response regulator
LSAGPDIESTATLKWLAGNAVPIPVLVVLQTNPGNEILEMVSRAADDFIVSPFGVAELRQRAARLLADPCTDLAAVRRRLIEEIGLTTLVGRDPAFLQAVGPLPRFARTEMPVCITGETGTGKELCARAIHHLSRRQSFPFIAVDCGAVPDQLLENEMFGHARGAFTDAHRDHKGLISMAQGGTLFLDEVDALSLPSQAKLLRFIQERTYRRLGSDRFDMADVRIVTATNRDLEALVEERTFRSDLYFRLNVLRLRLPPLRERRDDIELLAYAALKQHSPEHYQPPSRFSFAALRLLGRHDWPGNVRELYNVVQRAMVACEGDSVLPEHIELSFGPGHTSAEAAGDFRSERAAAIAAFERRFVETLLRKHRGNVTQAAREARQDRRAFGRFLKKYNIDRNTMIA